MADVEQDHAAAISRPKGLYQGKDRIGALIQIIDHIPAQSTAQDPQLSIPGHRVLIPGFICEQVP